MIFSRFMRWLKGLQRNDEDQKKRFKETSSMEFLGGLRDAWDDTERLQGETQKTRGVRDVRGSIQHGVSWKVCQMPGTMQSLH